MMKKKYQTPYIAVESFQLNAAIAGDCGSEGRFVLNHNEDTCGLNAYTSTSTDQPVLNPNALYEYWGAKQCEKDVNTNLYDNDEFCYHAFTAMKTIWS